MSSSPTVTGPSMKGRKVRAVLAGGLVLGVGAAVTLAAWTDEEWAVGNFGAGSFNMQGSTTGEEADFTDHASEAGAATLAFDVGADNLSPRDTVVAPFVLRTDADTTYDANVALASATGVGDNAANLSYEITQVGAAEECIEGASGTQIAPAGTSLSSIAGATAFELTAGAEGAAGAPVVLCFEVRASDTLAQGGTATASWELTATSVE